MKLGSAGKYAYNVCSPKSLTQLHKNFPNILWILLSHFSKGILNGEECVLHFSASVFTLMTIRIQRPFMLKVPLVSTNIQSNMYITLVSRFANA